jgi:hypothetical protein
MDSTIGNQENVNAEVGYPPLRVIGNIVSVLFHPLFIPLYVTAFLLYWHPTYFAGFNGQQKIRIMATIAVNLFLLPAVTVFLLWRLKFSNSIQLKTQKERIIPYAATMFFSFWAWNVFRNLSFSPETYNDFLLGVFITVIIGWMANIWFKISMHALGVGGMLFFVILVALSGEGSSGQYIATATAITGLTLSARLISSDHTGFELYGGLLLGAAAQYIATVV